ncbi:MAG: glycosyl transferase, group 1 [Patescibacteria group bacterium]|nr:glycosyl transferase, group 1 [Patescibacteria group bacterium]
MRIVIDARMLYWTGVGRYTKALLDNLEQIDHENEYVVLMRPADRKLWKPTAANFRIVEADIDPYSLGEQLRLPGVIRRLKPDVVHFTTPNGPVLYGGRRVVTVHDLTLLDYDTSRGSGLARWLRGLKRIPFRLILGHNVTHATGVNTVTQYVADQMIERFGATRERITVTWLASDPNLAKPAPIEKFGLGNDYILYWGNYYPYKNVGLLVEAFAVLAEAYPKLKMLLGGQMGFFGEELKKRVDQLGLGDRIVFSGFFTDGELVALCQHATLYVNPSLSEGFGLQGLEAMSQGAPVVSARASCLPEIYGEAAVYFDPHDAQDLAAKMRALLDDPTERERLQKAGYAHLKQFSWRETAEQTLEAYRRAGKA